MQVADSETDTESRETPKQQVQYSTLFQVYKALARK